VLWACVGLEQTGKCRCSTARAEMKCSVLVTKGRNIWFCEYIVNPETERNYINSAINNSPIITQKTKQTPWPLVRERTIPTERPPLVDEI
jgi:hypothetical protein